MCLEIGETMVFTIDDYNHYPVYVKDSILNSNTDFDYGPFVDLATKITAKKANGESDTVMFGFTFKEAGNYVFKDKTNTENYFFIVVASDTSRCPSSTSYVQPMTSRNLAGYGGSQSNDVIKDIDTWLVFTLLFSLGFLIAAAMISIAYCLHKQWKISP